MSEISRERKEALLNIDRSLDRTCRFPRNVFRGSWSCFFFDSDRMFVGEFVRIVQGQLTNESGECACLIKLDHHHQSTGSDHSIFIDHSTTPENYQELLKGAEPGHGWIDDMDRFGCSSDIGDWSVYCERMNEIAVVGLRPGTGGRQFHRLLSQLCAARISDAIQQPLSYGFSSEALSPQWRDELLKEYQN